MVGLIHMTFFDSGQQAVLVLNVRLTMRRVFLSKVARR